MDLSDNFLEFIQPNKGNRTLEIRRFPARTLSKLTLLWPWDPYCVVLLCTSIPPVRLVGCILL